MTDNAAGFDFSKFIPGFDFLQQMTQPNKAAPGLSQWVAPTLDPDEIGKRIQELKTVQFWLEQNATALKATIQALEVQQLTCSTLKNMNAQMTDVAASMQAAMQTPTESAEDASTSDTETAATDAVDAAALNTAMEQSAQWWGGLLETFQGIAQQAQSEVQQRQEEFMEAAAPKPAKKPAATTQRKTTSRAKTASTKSPRTKTAAAKPATRSRASSKTSTRSRPKKT